MNRAAAFAKEMAVLPAWHAQPRAMPRTIHIPLLEFARCHGEELRRARDIGVVHIDEALLLAASGAAGLAFETKRAIGRGCVYHTWHEFWCTIGWSALHENAF